MKFCSLGLHKWEPAFEGWTCRSFHDKQKFRFCTECWAFQCYDMVWGRTEYLAGYIVGPKWFDIPEEQLEKMLKVMETLRWKPQDITMLVFPFPNTAPNEGSK